MPTYEYECQACHHRFEVVQRFSDAPLAECADCGGELRKVFSAVGIVFKGGGFYKTDSRSGSTSSGSTDSGTSSSGD
jgi:putative FmdB family regulatory protein